MRHVCWYIVSFPLCGLKFQNYDKVCLDVCGGGGGEQNLRQYQVRTGENQPNEFSSAEKLPNLSEYNTSRLKLKQYIRMSTVSVLPILCIEYTIAFCRCVTPWRI